MKAAYYVLIIWFLLTLSPINGGKNHRKRDQNHQDANQTSEPVNNKTVSNPPLNQTKADINSANVSTTTVTDQPNSYKMTTSLNRTEGDLNSANVNVTAVTDQPKSNETTTPLNRTEVQVNSTNVNVTAVTDQPKSNETTMPVNRTEVAVNSTNVNATAVTDQPKLNDETTPSNETESDDDDWIDSKIGILTRISKMWHCLTDDYREPTFSDVRFFLFTRRNRHRSEELNLTLTDQIREQVHQLGVNPLRQLPFEYVARKTRRRNYRDAEDVKFTPLPESCPVRSKYFNAEVPTKFIIHGYTESSRDMKLVFMKRAYLNAGDYNVVMVDWHVLAKPPCYVNSVRYTKFVGYALAKLVDQLHLGDVDLGSLHMVGFSLGAHIAGYAGNKVVHGNIFRITGLDPALPFYTTDDPSEKLDRTDANFVDVIHTNAGWLGQNGPTGHADFYPNGGTFQPGCDKSDVFCSHKRAAEYFLESIASNRFKSVACGSYKDFKNNACNESDGATVMGEMTKVVDGTFYLFTNGSSPYAIG